MNDALLHDLERITDTDVITSDLLFERRLVRKRKPPVKILGNGEVTRALKIEVDAVSKSAREKIEAAGGQVTTP